MISSEITPITPYQMGLLTHTARSSAPIYLSPRPALKDRPSQRYKLLRREEEIRVLVDNGLLEDVTNEHREAIRDICATAGRKFRVYGLTEPAYLMFKDWANRPIN